MQETPRLIPLPLYTQVLIAVACGTVLGVLFGQEPYLGGLKNEHLGWLGLLLVTLPRDECEILMERAENPDTRVVVDLETQSVGVAGEDWKLNFDINPFVKHCLLNGLDDISLTLQHEPDITAFEKTRPSFMPVTIVR